MRLLRKKPLESVEAGGFRFDFYYDEGRIEGTYLQVSSESGLFSLRIGGNTRTYGYLLAAARMGRADQLQGYAETLYVPAMTLTQDQGLTNDVQKAIVKWKKRMEKRAQEGARKVTPEQEMAEEAFMREVAAYADANPKERKKMRKESKERMREVLNEKEGENGE